MGALALALGNLGAALAGRRLWLEAAAALEEALARHAALRKYGREDPAARDYAAKLEECRRAFGEAQEPRGAAGREVPETPPAQRAPEPDGAGDPSGGSEHAVRRILDLVRADALPEIPGATGRAPETPEARAAVLRNAMHLLGLKKVPCVPDEDEMQKAVVRLEALIAAPGEDTPENLCMRALALEALAEARALDRDVPGTVAALREGAELAGRAGAELGAERCRMLLKLARIFSKNGAMEESVAMAKQAVEVAECIHGTNNDAPVSVLPCALLELAEAHRLRGDAAASMAAAHRAGAALKAGPCPVVPEEVDSRLSLLAGIHEALGDMAGCVAFRRHAVAFWRNSVVKSGGDELFGKYKLALCLGRLGAALARGGQCQEACAALEEALMRYDGLDLGIRLLDPEYPGFVATLDECHDARQKELYPQEDMP